MSKYTSPRSATVIVDPSGTRLGTATDPVVVTGTVVPADPSVGPTGDPVPAEATLVGGENTLGDLEAPRIVTTALGPAFVVSDPALTDGTQLAQVTGTGAAGVPAAGVMSVQGVPGGTPVPVTGTVTASNPSVGAVGAVAPTSGTQVAGPDGSGNLAVAQVLTAEPVEATPGMAVRVVPGATPFPVAAANLQYLLNVLAQVLGQAQDPAGRLRVLIDPIGGAQSLPVTVSSGTVTTVSTVSNQTSIGGAIAASVVFDQMQTAWATSLRGQIT